LQAAGNPNPKSEIRNKSKKKGNSEKLKTASRVVFDVAPSDFGFVSDFEFRASDLDHKVFGRGCVPLNPSRLCDLMGGAEPRGAKNRERSLPLEHTPGFHMFPPRIC
jgi:hypothetical protein